MKRKIHLHTGLDQGQGRLVMKGLGRMDLDLAPPVGMPLASGNVHHLGRIHLLLFSPALVKTCSHQFPPA